MGNQMLRERYQPVLHDDGYGQMHSKEFRDIQASLRINDQVTADLLRVTVKTVNSWRNARGRITGPAALAMRMLRKHSDELSHWRQIQGADFE